MAFLTPSVNSSSLNSSGLNTSVTSSHTIVAGPNRVLYAYLALGDFSVAPTCTYGGVSMTLIENNTVQFLFRLINPPVGTANIVASWTEGNRNNNIIGVCMQNVNLVAPNGAVFKATFTQPPAGPQTNPGITVTSNSSETVLDFVFAVRPIGTAQLLVVGAGQAQIQNNGSKIFPLFSTASSYAPGETSATMGWNCSMSDPGSYWYQLGISVKPDSPSQFFYWF